MNIHIKGLSKKFRAIGTRYFAPVFFALLVVLSFAAVHHAFAQTVTTTQTLPGGVSGQCDGVVKKCDWQALIDLINRAINYILVFTVPLAAIMFAYAGILLMTKGSSPQAQEHAKGIFFNVVVGIILALAAFLIIKTILDALGVTASGGYRIFTH